MISGFYHADKKSITVGIKTDDIDLFNSLKYLDALERISLILSNPNLIEVK